jgi:hypothetical protein
MSLNTYRVGAPTEALRVAVVIAAVPSTFFSCGKAPGELYGVIVNLGRAIAAELTIPIELTGYPTSGGTRDHSVRRWSGSRGR